MVEAERAALLTQLPAAVWVVGSDLRIRSWSAGATDLPADAAELLAIPLHIALDLSPDDALLAAHRSALQGAGGRVDLTRAGRIYEVTLSAVPDGTGVIAVAIEATQSRHNMAREQHRQKLESLGTLAGGIAHDFNNLLVGILGNSSLALMDLPEGGHLREAVTRVETAATRASDLCRQLLAYSGKGKFVDETFDLGDLLAEMTQLLRLSHAATVSLRVDVEPSTPPIHGDQAQVRQVVMNLLTNASDAVAERNGFVHIRVGSQQVDAGYLNKLELGAPLAPGRYTFIEVSDDGVGMTPDCQVRIFEPFFTTKLAGHGLGLAAVQGIVRGHGGAIKVYSELGKGTTVKVLFPSSAAEARVVEPARPGVVAPRSLRVLVVDDEAVVREVAGAALAHAGHTALFAEDGAEGIRVFDANVDAIDAVLLDLTLPLVSGAEVYRHIRSVRPGLPVLLSSGYNEVAATAAFVGKGLAGFIQKPWRAPELLNKLNEVVQSAEREGG